MSIQNIVLAGGCFWGVQHFFSLAKGIVNSECGYAQSQQAAVTYQEACAQTLNAVEVVQVTYDSAQISLAQILEYLFRIIDPTSLNQQGGDIGLQYRVGLYYDNTPEGLMQGDIAHQFVAEKQADYPKKIVFEVQALQQYNSAEDYHQAYLVKNPTGYCHVDMKKLLPHERK
jgi:methionine-S-sulfoxide reductase